METNQILKNIYRDLKEELVKGNKTFIKEYKIPSINYSKNNDSIKDKYFISGIEMELHYMIEQLENRVSYARYQDLYFFSNNEKLCHDVMLNKITKEIIKDCKDNRININEFAEKIKENLEKTDEEEMQ